MTLLSLNNIAQKKASGFTLVEILIAMVLGLFVIGAVVSIFLQVKTNSRVNEVTGRLQENGRYALYLLSEDLKQTGFFGKAHRVSDIEDDTSLAGNIGAVCGAAGAASWLKGLDTLATLFDYTMDIAADEIEGIHNCIDEDDFYAGTATLTTRHVMSDSALSVTNPANTALSNNRLYVRTNGSQSCLWFSEGDNIPNSTACPGVGEGAEDWEVQTNVYFIKQGDNPELCRKVISQGVDPLIMREECLLEGIEHFHIEFGFDTDDDFRANRYDNEPPAGSTYNDAVSARIYVLAKATSADRDYTNSKVYTLGQLEIDPDDDSFRRKVFTTTIPLRNVTNLGRF